MPVVNFYEKLKDVCNSVGVWDDKKQTCRIKWDDGDVIIRPITNGLTVEKDDYYLKIENTKDINLMDKSLIKIDFFGGKVFIDKKLQLITLQARVVDETYLEKAPPWKRTFIDVTLQSD